MKLKEFRENPENPSVATPEEIKRLAGKLERVPLGLTAMRIAYITDDPAGGKMVLFGNKRLRVLKEKYGDDYDLPDDYFQDITAMTPAERHEFIITANISDGQWDVDRLLEQYDKAELKELMDADVLNGLLDDEPLQFDITEKYDSLKDCYVAFPCSILHGYKKEWLDRKRAWKKVIPASGESREGVLKNSGGMGSLFCKTCGDVSIFDPVLAEVLCRWFCPPEGKIFDTFSGDTLKGLVFAQLGHYFRGIELRQEQIDENYKIIEKYKVLNPNIDIDYYCDDGQNVEKHFQENTYDMYFSCPPYFDLEVYSDDARDASNQGTYEDFLKIMETSFSKAVKVLKDDRFAVVVIGDVRDKNGFYRGMPDDIVRIFVKNGCKLYNRIIYLTPPGNSFLTARHTFDSKHKLLKVHQEVLVFYKGDPDEISKNYPAIKYKDSDLLEFFNENGDEE